MCRGFVSISPVSTAAVRRDKIPILGNATRDLIQMRKDERAAARQNDLRCIDNRSSRPGQAARGTMVAAASASAGLNRRT